MPTQVRYLQALIPLHPEAGVVVANDAEAQRCNLLTHQTKRICSPALLVTNHDASQFPLVAPRRAAKVVWHLLRLTSSLDHVLLVAG